MKPRWGKWDVILVSLLLGSVAVVFWHASVTHPTLRLALEWLDAALCLFFVSEWAYRGVKSGHPARFGLRHAWELLGMVPIVAPLPAALRVLRLARLVRVLRVFGTLGRTLGTWERIAKQGNLGTVGLAGAGFTLLGSFLVWVFERDSNPNFAQFSEALWWGIVTVTTVGYGDITPLTHEGRVIAALLMITGIGMIGLLASNLASALVLGDAGSTTVKASLADDLQTLAGLHGAGRLTDEEFASAKEKLLR